MNSIINSGHLSIAAAFVIQLSAIIPASLIKDERKAFFASNIVLISGLVLGLISTLSSVLFSPEGFSGDNIFLLNNWIRLDGLGLYFLFIIQLVAIPIAVYSFSYLPHYIDQRRPVRSFVSFFTIVMVSTQLVVIANQALFFLVSWEIMSVSACLGMMLEKEKEEVQKGSFYYFTATHVSAFILYIFFFLLHHATGSWFFSDYHDAASAGIIIPVLFILSFIGFGIKAGFMPFHFWLPKAHPIAPTVLSAFLSGIIIKTGIYGILRTFQFLNPIPEWCGWVVLSVSIISAIFGVWYALAQHDIKRLLAYHSVENIGIIGIGIGIGVIGAANNLPVLEVLGFGGALLHTLNHAIFKSLLFLGSGVIYRNMGTRNIELMGGIVHRAKYLALFFLIGSIAISGLPPFNGFISEFIIYTGFFRTARELQNYYPLLMLMFVVGLAFVGGLAVACFTKVNSIMFLGTERKEGKEFHTSVFDYISLGFLSFLCIGIGFYPQPSIGIVNKIIGGGFAPVNSTAALTNMNWLNLSLIFSAIAAGAILLYLAKLGIQKKYGHRKSAPWGCGYEKITPRMQYTASSFADELNTIPQSILGYSKEVSVSKGVFPKLSKFESRSEDFVDNKIVLRGYGFLQKLISKIEFLSHTDIRYYIGFILIIITIYSFIAFIWE
jgi:hydrogenase-4 component B